MKNKKYILSRIKKRIFANINKMIDFIVYKFFTLFPIKNKKIICNNFLRKGFGDNPKYIVLEMLNQNLNYDIVWVMNSENDMSVPSGVRVVSKWYKVLYEYATAKIWISNVRLPKYFKKRKKQFYIQTWHAGIALKKVEKDVMDVLSKEYLKSAIADAKNIDVMIANSKFCVDLYKNAFWYDGPILCEGLPRNDGLVNYKKNKTNKDADLVNYKVLLYAPTFRANNNCNNYNIDFEKLIKILNDNTNEKWKVIVKLHPNIDNSSSYIKFSNNVLNYSKKSDINELLLMADLLITDYSSVMFDYMLMNKPIILYANDIEEYKKDRNFYIKFEELPFPLTTNNEELFETVKKIKKQDYKKRYDRFGKKYGLNETGKSSKSVVDLIKKVTKESL